MTIDKEYVFKGIAFSNYTRQYIGKTTTIDSEILSKVLLKIRPIGEKCNICTSGKCVVCKAFEALEKSR